MEYGDEASRPAVIFVDNPTQDTLYYFGLIFANIAVIFLAQNIIFRKRIVLENISSNILIFRSVLYGSLSFAFEFCLFCGFKKGHDVSQMLSYTIIGFIFFVPIFAISIPTLIRNAFSEIKSNQVAFWSSFFIVLFDLINYFYLKASV